MEQLLDPPGDVALGSTDEGLLDQALEFGAQCGAKLGSSGQAVAFTYYVTVSNWSDTLRILRVLYADGEEMARYQIPPHTSFSFSQAAGGTATGVSAAGGVAAGTPWSPAASTWVDLLEQHRIEWSCLPFHGVGGDGREVVPAVSAKVRSLGEVLAQ